MFAGFSFQARRSRTFVHFSSQLVTGRVIFQYGRSDREDISIIMITVFIITPLTKINSLINIAMNLSNHLTEITKTYEIKFII